jgi:hypothetical protein
VITDRQRTCVHEAGHCVGYLTQGYKFDWVVVNVDGTGNVHVPTQWMNIKHRAICCLAGPAAEAKLISRPIASLFAGIAATDLTMAHQAIARGVIPYDIQVIITDATRLVDDHWRMVMTFAAALDRHHRLEYTQVLELLTHNPHATGRLMNTRGRGWRISNSSDPRPHSSMQ